MEHYFTNSDNLKSNFRTIVYKINDTTLNFTSDLGVFSKDKVDFGSDLLIKTYIEKGKPNISLLDVGCGYGIIGITLAKCMNTLSTLIDVNKRALHLSDINIKNIGVNAKTKLSNVYDAVDEKYDVIITNPPIRAGKSIVHEIFLGAKEHLNEDGELWIVIRKEQGAKSALEFLRKYYNVEVINKSKGFYIILCKKLLTPV